MIELGQLEKNHAEFAKRRVRIAAIANDDLETSKKTQASFPHLLIVSDKDQKLAAAVQTIHRGAAMGGGDTNVPTTFLVDGSGNVRWWFRAERYVVRLSPEHLLAEIDEALSSEKGIR